MIPCNNVEVIKNVGRYLNTSVGPICYNTDRIVTTVLDKDNVEGFVSIILRLATKSSIPLSVEQRLLAYQWLEHTLLFADQALANSNSARIFLQEINQALAKTTYLTGNFCTVADVAVYHVLYPIIERLSVTEKESLLHLCRWSKHIQAQPRVSSNKPPLQFNTLPLAILAPAAH